jgi:hypothetical protein
MKENRMLKLKIQVLVGTLFCAILGMAAMVSCAGIKPVARTVNDVARVACETMFGQEELPQGLTLRDVCTAQKNLQPFIDSILSAKAQVDSAGLAPPTKE